MKKNLKSVASFKTEFFEEMALIDSQVRSDSVKEIEKLVLLEVRELQFRDILLSDPDTFCLYNSL